MFVARGRRRVQMSTGCEKDLMSVAARGSRVQMGSISTGCKPDLRISKTIERTVERILILGDWKTDQIFPRTRGRKVDEGWTSTGWSTD